MNSVPSIRVRLIVFISSLCLLLFPQDAVSQIFVTNTNDDGPGSLRSAIDLANTNIGADLIHFNIPSNSDQIIFVGQTTGVELPALSDQGTIIDGTTQNGFGNGQDFSPKIILDGSAVNWDSPINALFILASDCEVYGLEIRNFPDDGIDILDSDNVVIGGIEKGNIIYNNGSAQDFFPGANPPNSGPWEGCGIVIREGSNNCQIHNNIIGTNETFGINLGNEYCGIIIRGASNNQITNSNYIVGNATGIRIDNAINNLVSQNSFYCNDTSSIILVNGANANLASPTISSATSSAISGSASNGNFVEIYINDSQACSGAVCQGSVYIGQAQINQGVWTLNAPFSNGINLLGGEVITAVNIDNAGNTSPFASCVVATGENCAGPDGVLIVENSNDQGAGSLREAIECANASPGPNTIVFAIPGQGPHVIPVGQDSGLPLPALIDENTILDATTQPGFGTEDFSPEIILDGQFFEWTGPHNAIWVQGDSCEVYGFEIRNFPDDAIDVTAGDFVKIGDANKGNVIYSNGWDLDFFPDAPNTGPWNGCAIVLKSNAENCIVRGNTIGTNYGQTMIAGNEYCGIIILNGGDDNIIGGNQPGQANVIANNEIAIRIALGSDRCAIMQNEVYCNYFEGILLSSDVNESVLPPLITAADFNFITGTAATDGIVDVYLNDTTGCETVPCQGRYFLGSALVSNGNWQLNAPFSNALTLGSGDLIGAIFTIESNSSEYSACFALPLPCINTSVSVSQLVNASCAQSNGQAIIDATGFNGNVMYDIGNGPVADNVFTGLAAGEYSVEVTDESNCAGIVSFSIENSGIPQLSLTSIINVDCGFSNGAFTVGVTSGQSPYTYNIGYGEQSQNVFEDLAVGLYTVVVSDATGCINSVSLQIGTLPGPQLSVSGSIDETCNESNGSFILNINGGSAPYSYNYGNGTFDSPVFTNLDEGTYNVTVTDAGACTDELAVNISNSGELAQSAFAWELGESSDAYNFTNFSLGGISYLWDFGDGNTSLLENPPTHVFTMDGEYTVCLTAENNCGAATFCEIINVIVPLADVTIQGLILKENGQTVSGVEISCTSVLPQVTASNGLFDFGGLTAGANYTLEPHKNVNHNNGLSVFDVFRIQQHILFFDTLDSPYRIIAADVNNNGVISVGDVTFVKQLILLNLDTFPNNESWRFVPAAYDFVDPLNPLNEAFPEILDYESLLTDAFDQDIIAIKTGDVTLDSDPDRMPFQTLKFTALEEYDSEGNAIYWFSSAHFDKVSAFQMALAFAEDIVPVEIIPGVLNELGNIQFNHVTNGKLAMLWADESGSTRGQTFSENEILFGLKLKLNGNSSNGGLSISNELIENIAFDPNGVKRNISIELEQTSVSTFNAKHGANIFHQNVPNPFDNSSRINFELVEATNLSFSIYDVKGRRLKTVEGFYPKGNHNLEITAEDLNAKGIYFYELKTDKDTRTFKMIFH